MSIRLFLIAIGVVWLVFGYFLFVEGSYYSWRFGRVLDFGGFNRPVGVLFVLAGAAFLWTGWRRGRATANR